MVVWVMVYDECRQERIRVSKKTKWRVLLSFKRYVSLKMCICYQKTQRVSNRTNVDCCFYDLKRNAIVSKKRKVSRASRSIEKWRNVRNVLCGSNSDNVDVSVFIIQPMFNHEGEKEKKTSKKSQEESPKRNEETTDERVRCKCGPVDMSLLIPQDTSSYFTESYFSTNKTWPSTCQGCNNRFGGIGMKVNQRNPVMACKNACISAHPCTFAYCWKCFNDLMVKDIQNTANTSRVRSRRDRKGSGRVRDAMERM